MERDAGAVGRLTRVMCVHVMGCNVRNEVEAIEENASLSDFLIFLSSSIQLQHQPRTEAKPEYNIEPKWKIFPLDFFSLGLSCRPFVDKNYVNFFRKGS